MDSLIAIPRELAVPRPERASYVRMQGTELLVKTLKFWRRRVIKNYGGDTAGHLVVNSCYRPESDLVKGRELGITEHDYHVDFTDANGHWTGCAVDFSSRLTAESFWGRSAPKWRRDDIRDSLVATGLYLPWYWKNGVEGGSVLEYWHASVEASPWTQTNAYRGKPPHWYDGLRPDSQR